MKNITCYVKTVENGIDIDLEGIEVITKTEHDYLGDPILGASTDTKGKIIFPLNDHWRGLFLIRNQIVNTRHILMKFQKVDVEISDIYIIYVDSIVLPFDKEKEWDDPALILQYIKHIREKQNLLEKRNDERYAIILSQISVNKQYN